MSFFTASEGYDATCRGCVPLAFGMTWDKLDLLGVFALCGKVELFCRSLPGYRVTFYVVRRERGWHC